MFGIKFLLALGMFFITSMLHGRSASAAKFQQIARTWLNVNVVLGIAIVMISGYLRSLPHPPKSPAAVEITEKAS
jgi:hypothetical protein